MGFFFFFKPFNQIVEVVVDEKHQVKSGEIDQVADPTQKSEFLCNLDIPKLDL